MPAAPSPPTGRRASWTGLTNGTEYFFSVTAHSAAGDSPTATSGFGTTPSPDEDDDDPDVSWYEDNDIPGIRHRIRSLVGPDRWGIHVTDVPRRHLTLRVRDLTPEEQEDLLAALGPQRELVSIESTTISLLELDRAIETVRAVVLAMPRTDAFVSSAQDPVSQSIIVTTTDDADALERALRAAMPEQLLSFAVAPRRRAMLDAGVAGAEGGQPS